DRDESIAGQEDDLPAPALAERDWRRVAGRIVEALPVDLAAVLVEGDDRGPLCTDVDQHVLALDQRRAGDAEAEVRWGEVLGRIDGPELLAVLRIPADEVPGDAEGVQLAIVERRRGARPDAEQGDEPVMQRAALVLLGPDRLAAVGLVGGDFLGVL